MSLLLLLALASLLLSALAVPPIKRLAWRLDLVDHPAAGPHKSHLRAMPYGGGLAILLAAVLVSVAGVCYVAGDPDPNPLLAGLALQGRTLALLLAGAGLLFLVGLADDWRGLSPLPRFLAQLGVTGLLVLLAPEFRLGVFSDLPAVSGALAVVWIAAMTNAFNFLDNMDGLAAGIAAIALALLGLIGLVTGHLFTAVLGLVLVGAIAGFLLYNFPSASIFMGDAGGFSLGFLVSGLSALLSNHCGPVLPYSLAPLLVLSLPAYDFASVIALRLSRRIPPWHGDRNHLSHRLVRRGHSRRGAVLTIHLLTLVTGLPALLALRAAPGAAWAWLLLVPVLAGLGAWLDLVWQRPYPD